MYYDLEGMLNDDDYGDDDDDFDMSDEFDEFKDIGLWWLELRLYWLFDEFDDEYDIIDWLKWKLDDFSDDVFFFFRGLWFVNDFVDFNVFESFWKFDNVSDMWKSNCKESGEDCYYWWLWLGIDEYDISVDKKWRKSDDKRRKSFEKKKSFERKFNFMDNFIY